MPLLSVQTNKPVNTTIVIRASCGFIGIPELIINGAPTTKGLLLSTPSKTAKSEMHKIHSIPNRDICFTHFVPSKKDLNGTKLKIPPNKISKYLY